MTKQSYEGILSAMAELGEVHINDRSDLAACIIFEYESEIKELLQEKINSFKELDYDNPENTGGVHND